VIDGIPNLSANKILTIREGKGVVEQKDFNTGSRKL
jgi:hypothetical protein